MGVIEKETSPSKPEKPSYSHDREGLRGQKQPAIIRVHMVMKEVVDEFANDEDMPIEVEKKSKENQKLSDIQSNIDLDLNKAIDSTKNGGRRTKSKPRKVSPLPVSKNAFKKDSEDKKEKTAEEEVAEDVEQIVAFLKETDPANKVVHETPAPQ